MQFAWRRKRLDMERPSGGSLGYHQIAIPPPTLTTPWDQTECPLMPSLNSTYYIPIMGLATVILFIRHPVRAVSPKRCFETHEGGIRAAWQPEGHLFRMPTGASLSTLSFPAYHSPGNRNKNVWKGNDTLQSHCHLSGGLGRAYTIENLIIRAKKNSVLHF